MVCPNCHSDNIIEVQGQHFCINCGQALPQTAIEANGVQASGLPLGVKILPASGIPAATRATAMATTEATPKPSKATPKVADSKGQDSPTLIVKSRSRLKPDETDEDQTDSQPEPPQAKDTPAPQPKPAAEPPLNEATADTKPKKRKPGRPKSGPIDAPRQAVAMTAPALPEAPQLGQSKAPAPVPAPVPVPAATPTAKSADAPLDGPRRMSDIAPRKTRTPHHSEHSKAPSALTEKNSQSADTHKDAAKSQTKPDHKVKRKHKTLFSWLKHQPKHQSKRHHVHKVGVPSLHFGAVMKFSLRASARPRHLGLASLAAVTFAAAVAYGLWLLLTEGPNRLAAGLQHPAPTLIAQLAGLAALFYVGRSIGRAALTFGVAREADQRPVPLSKQLGVGVNTFGRHLTMDLLYGLIQLALLAIIALLVITGGQTWPVDIQLQMGALFVAFLLLLYLLAAMTITRGLAGVAVTLTSERPKTAVKLGWRLFSHRFELLGLRFLAAAVELLVALPLAALAVAFVSAAPSSMKLLVTLGVAVIAWLTGALIGAGSAAWWTALYRQLVLADHPDRAVNLLSGRPASDANRGPLALIVSISTLLIVTVLVLPFINL